MTSKNYTSRTGLYSVRFGPDLIHEGLTHVEASEWMDHYKRRSEDGSVAWPLEPERLSVEEFSGNYILKPKR